MEAARTARSIPQLIGHFGERLQQAGIEAGPVEIELVLMHLLKVDRLTLYMHGEAMLSEEHRIRLEEIVEKRRARYPLQYILESAWFYGREFRVTDAVMVPTPETELLCEAAMNVVRTNGWHTPRILDVGTGSGVIAVTMVAECDACRMTALDISPEALAIARGNAEHHDVNERIRWLESDLLAAIRPHERFELILANPPYIADHEYDELPPEVLADPKIALTSGPEGLDHIKRLIDTVPAFLAPRGRLLFEIGYNQAEAITRLTEADERYTSFTLIKDLNDIDRIVLLGCDSVAD